jgi:hypothetical protein
METIPSTSLTESLGIANSTNFNQTESILVGRPTARELATALFSSLNLGADKLPTLEDITDECLYEHELDHLCRKTTNPTRCNREPPSLSIQADCLRRKFDDYCGVINPENRSLCLNICNQYVHYGAISQFAQCFCNELEADNQLPGSFYDPESRNNCCECNAQCRRFQIPEQCRRFENTLIRTRQRACDGTLLANSVHTCEWYGGWPSLARNKPSVVCPDPLAEIPE